MTRPRNFRLALSLALALLVVGLGGLSVYRKVQTFQALGFEVTPQAGGVLVSSVQIPRTGLKPGDEIIAINGHEVPTRDQLVEGLRERPTSELGFTRGDQFLRLKYHRRPIEIDFPYLILCLISVLYLGVGLFTLLRQRDGQGFLFYLWCLTSAALYLLTPTYPAGAARTLIYLGDEIARLLLPALTLHLFLVFPTPVFAIPTAPETGTGPRLRRLIPYFYLPAAVMIALQLDMVLNHGHMVFGKVNVARLAALDRIELLYFAVFLLAAIGVLFWRFRRGAAWEQHRQMQWMALGVAGGYLPFLVLYFAPLALRLGPSPLLTSIAVLPLALVPLTFAYAILRYKLWDIEVIVRDTISLTLTLLLGIIGFSLVNLAITHGVSAELSLARNVLLFLSGLGIAGLLVPTRGAISSALERIHYRDTFGKRKALTGLGRELLQERDLGRLCSALIDRIQEAVDVEATNLYLYQGDALAVIRAEPGLPGRVPLNILGEEFWLRDFERLSGVGVSASLPAELLPPARLFAAGYRYAFPLTVRGRGIGVVLAGFKRDHMPLNSEDTDLIRHLLNQAALAIENAQLVGQLQLQLEEVRQLQSYTEGIFESSPAGIAVLDGERRLQSANSAFAGIVGRSRDEISGLSLEAVLPVQPLPAPGEGPVEARWSDAQGRERHLQLSLAAFEHGWRQGLYVLVVHDVSERVAMENALHEKDRMAALGMLAAGVAHEVNTPITGISSYAQMLLQEMEPSNPHYDILKKVERQTFRASRIVNNLLEHARNRQNEKSPVAVAPLVAECLDLLAERMSQRHIALQWTPPADGVSLQVMGCDGELQQVFTNLIVNAIDAMNDTGGRLTVGLTASDTQVLLRVQDTGLGVPADKLEMVFQPFYSTKLSRGGTGLGLSISTEIVQRHGGTLRVVSPPGEGACFVVELPRFQPPATPTA